MGSPDAVTDATVRMLASSFGGGRPDPFRSDADPYASRAVLRPSDWIPTVEGRSECSGGGPCEDTAIVHVAVCTAAVVVLVHVWSLWDAIVDARARRTNPRSVRRARSVGCECAALLVASGGAAIFLRDVGRCANQSAVYKLIGALAAANVALPWAWGVLAADHRAM